MGLFISLEKYAMQMYSPHNFTTHAIVGNNVWKFVEKVTQKRVTNSYEQYAKIALLKALFILQLATTIVQSMFCTLHVQ